MSGEELGRLLAALPGKPWREATIETAPGVLGAGATSVAVIADLLAGDLGGRARAFIAACQ